MSNVRKLVIVLLATTAGACTIGPLPPQLNQDAAAGAGGSDLTKVEVLVVKPTTEASATQ